MQSLQLSGCVVNLAILDEIDWNKLPNLTWPQIIQATRTAPINQAQTFNQLLLLAAFYVKWRGIRKSILPMMDVYSRFEQEAILEDEHPESEIKLIEQYCIRWAGPPLAVQIDASRT